MTPAPVWWSEVARDLRARFGGWVRLAPPAIPAEQNAQSANIGKNLSNLSVEGVSISTRKGSSPAAGVPMRGLRVNLPIPMPKSWRLLATTFLIGALPLIVAAADAKMEPPVPVRTVDPEYPRDLLRERVNGLVMIKCTVDENGNVLAPEVVKSSNEAFEKPALEALARWKFKPAKQDGAAVAMKVSIPIRFVHKG